MTRFLGLLVAVALLTPVQASQWQKTLASTASLRAGGAHLVSSDVLGLKGGQTGLITYWEFARGSTDLDIYRCVDVVGLDFEPINQDCWKVLTAVERRPIED